MTKREQQIIAKSLISTVRQLRISREDKARIYYGHIAGLAQCDGFNEDYLFDFDIVFNEQLREYKRRNKGAILNKV